MAMKGKAQLPTSFLESSLPTRALYTASLLLPDEQRQALESSTRASQEAVSQMISESPSSVVDAACATSHLPCAGGLWSERSSARKRHDKTPTHEPQVTGLPTERRKPSTRSDGQRRIVINSLSDDGSFRTKQFSKAIANLRAETAAEPSAEDPTKEPAVSVLALSQVNWNYDEQEN